MSALPPVPYPAIHRHGLIGDRRTAALVSAEGTLDWLPLPDYDREILFGALLDARGGGFWHLGPIHRQSGRQAYVEDTTSLVTTWDLPDGRLELTDVMPWPETERPSGRQEHRAVVRRLRCLAGRCRCRLLLCPSCSFQPVEPMPISERVVSVRTGRHNLELWSSVPIMVDFSGARADFPLEAGAEMWCVLACEHPAAEWSAEKAAEAMAQSDRYWRKWSEEVACMGPRRARVRRSAILIHQLSYAPTGAHVAAPTTSLPEGVGGSRNWDYRLTWIRDTSLSVGILSKLGQTEEARRYMEWLGRRTSSEGEPFQVVYGIRGEEHLPEIELRDVVGYRRSKPVRLGNRAYQQDQHGSLGYLALCALDYLKGGGQWHADFWDLVWRSANYIGCHWEQSKNNSIWELSVPQHYLSGKVLSWCALNSAIEIAERLGRGEEAEPWRQEREKLKASVLKHGWSDRARAFRQRYEADNIDAAVLLVPLTGLLPADDPRVQATVAKVEELLTYDGFVYRFDPLATPGVQEKGLMLGELEGAFLPCTFWLAAVYAQMGRRADAEHILETAEEIAGPLGLFAECIDPRTREFLGNSPLLFSQMEYVRAVLLLENNPGREGK